MNGHMTDTMDTFLVSLANTVIPTIIFVVWYCGIQQEEKPEEPTVEKSKDNKKEVPESNTDENEVEKPVEKEPEEQERHLYVRPELRKVASPEDYQLYCQQSPVTAE